MPQFVFGDDLTLFSMEIVLHISARWLKKNNVIGFYSASPADTA